MVLLATSVSANTALAPDLPPQLLEAPLKAPEAPVAKVELKYGKVLIDELISTYAAKYGVDPDVLSHIVKNESQYNRFAKGDTDYVCPRTGKVSPSYGLVQINTCWHPEVSYAQATDPAFAIRFLATGIAQGRCKEWSTCPL